MFRIPTALLTFIAIFSACSDSRTNLRASDSETIPVPTYKAVLPESLRPLVDVSFTGDLDSMLKRRIIRIAAPFNRTHYFIDRGVQRGLSYEYAKLLEDELNSARRQDLPKIHVLMVPMPRDMLIPALNSGKVDMIVAQMTVTPTRLKQVDFTHPTRANVNEIIVSGKATRPIASLEELSGQEVFVRASSSYFESLTEINNRLQAEGRPPVIIRCVSESLEDDDLLEMVNAGLLPATVVDDYLAKFWKKVFGDLVLHEHSPLRRGGSLAVAIRKGSPRLAATLNEFIDRNGLDSTLGRVLDERYLQNTEFALNATSQGEIQKFVAMRHVFRKFGEQYDLDDLLMAAQAYQESRLDQSARSEVGAIGVMQLMPATGREQDVGDIHQLGPNVHAGIKYMHTLISRYFRDDAIDQLNRELFALASYNAGPGRIRQLRREAEQRGLNPNVWFGNVEQIASERIGRETVNYVSSIYKYYVAYWLVNEQIEWRALQKSLLASART